MLMMMYLRSLLFVSIVIWSHCDAFEMKLNPTQEMLGVKTTGDDFFIKCSVGFAPEEVADDSGVEIKWYFTNPTGDQVLVPTEKSGVYQQEKRGNAVNLVFGDQTPDDTGLYTCKGTVLNAEDDAKIRVTILGEIGFEDCAVTQNPVAGTDAEIKCEIKGQPAPTIDWEKDGVKISEGDERGHTFKDGDKQYLIIPNYDLAKDDGTYKVTIQQDASSSFRNREIVASGHTKPTIVTSEWAPTHEGFEAHPLKLQCSAEGFPAPTFKWKKGDQELETSDRYKVDGGDFEILQLTPTDAGTYTCVAENPVGTDTADVEVTVFLAPKIDAIDDVTQERGSEVDLKCVYSGDDVTAYWTFNDMSLPTQDQGETEIGRYSVESMEEGEKKVLLLKIIDVSLTDATKYTCRVSNNAGHKFEETNLKIIHSPMRERTSAAEVRTILGEEATMFCEVQAVPAPEWTWMFQGKSIESSDERTITTEDSGLLSTLTISSMTANDFGEYECVADNEVPEQFAHKFTVYEISTPPVPVITVEEAHPNYAVLAISNAEEFSGAALPDTITFFFAPSADVVDEYDFETSATQANLSWEEDGIFRLPNLETETAYQVKASASNLAGKSSLQAEATEFMTEAAAAPGAPEFDEDNYCEGSKCEVGWELPNDHGSEITAYQLSWIELESDEENASTVGDETFDKLEGGIRSYNFWGLLPDSFYRIKVAAVNGIGEGPYSSTIIKTPIEPEFTKSATVSTAVIVVIVIIILIIILILVDLSCYYVNHCGVIMSICVNFCGKTPPDVKEKQHALEEGSLKTGEKEPLQERSEEEKGASNEADPMISEKSAKNTVV